MENLIEEAKKLIGEFKGNDYEFGTDVLKQVGPAGEDFGLPDFLAKPVLLSLLMLRKYHDLKHQR